MGPAALTEPPIHAGAVDAAVAAELPGLGLSWCEFAVADDVLRRSLPELRARLRTLSDRRARRDGDRAPQPRDPHAYRRCSGTWGSSPT